jgi:site-specific recombinase XerD
MQDNFKAAQKSGLPTLATQTPGRVLREIPQESVWLANFVSKRTRETYSNAVREFIALHGITSAEELKEIDQAHVIAWRDSLIKSGASPKTVHNRISAVSSLFKHLCEKQIVKRNPTTGVKRPHVDSSQVKTPVITPEQVRKILEAPEASTPQGLRDRAILHILFYTGCRISEVCSLNVKDFYEDGGYYVLDFVVKGGKRNRLAIHQELQIALRDYLRAAGHENNDEAPLILAAKSKPERNAFSPLTRQQMHNVFMKYTKRAKLPKGVRPHTARATFITQALERKCPIEAVQRSVGHSRISTTQMYDKRTLKHRESASFAVVY